MASARQRPIASATARGNEARATPPLQTGSNDLNRNARYSFMETPVEMQRSTFQPYHQFSSPTNSTIDESPISPASPSRGLPSYLQETQGPITSPIPLEKAQAQSPQETHPAYYAPYKEDVPAQPASQRIVAVAPHSPGPIPVKNREGPTHPTAAPVSNACSQRPSTASEPKIAIERQEIYNPDSLSGPNVGTQDHRPGQVSHPNATIDPHWKNGFCEPDALCCMGLICPCLVYGKTMYRLSRKAQKQDPTDLLGYESCNGSCGLMAAACGFQWILAAIQRTRIRKIYHLEGGVGTDCVKAFCCCCCVIMQNEREVRDREELIRRHAGPATGAYVAPGAMTYAPPPR
ncbi:hypothetical protein MMC28_011174 [Mycoblastus sanguinarius]|nr:hypothetical protein [Mycoblastus sanguinarius]